MQISSSLIRGAGSGLLLRPIPPGRQEVTEAYGGAGEGVYDPQVHDKSGWTARRDQGPGGFL